MLSGFKTIELHIAWTDLGGDLTVDHDEVDGDNDDDEHCQEHWDGGVEHIVLSQIFTCYGISVLTLGSFYIKKNDQSRCDEQDQFSYKYYFCHSCACDTGFVLHIPVDGQEAICLLQNDVIVEGEEAEVLQKIRKFAEECFTGGGDDEETILDRLYTRLGNKITENVQSKNMNWLQIVSRFLVNLYDETGKVECKNRFNVVTELVLGFLDVGIMRKV